MNKELRELFDKNHIITHRVTLKNHVRIIDSGDKKFVIKRREKKIDDIYQYLKSRSFVYFPDIIFQTENYDVYQYIDDVDLPLEEKAIDIIKLVTMLHSKTTFYKEIDDDTYKELYESIIKEIDYLRFYYDDISSLIEKEEFMSPSNYYFIRNVSKVFSTLDYAREQIDTWFSILKDKKRIRVVQIHNNLSLDHYLLSDKPYFISWRLSKKDLPIYDLIKLYKRYYRELDFCDLLKLYEKNYPMLPEEKILFFVLISIPDKLEFRDDEFSMCKMVKKFYDYLSSSDKLIKDYMPKKKVEI